MHALPANVESGDAAGLDLPVHLVFGKCLSKLQKLDIAVTSPAVV